MYEKDLIVVNKFQEKILVRYIKAFQEEIKILTSDNKTLCNVILQMEEELNKYSQNIIVKCRKCKYLQKLHLNNLYICTSTSSPTIIPSLDFFCGSAVAREEGD